MKLLYANGTSILPNGEQLGNKFITMRRLYTDGYQNQALCKTENKVVNYVEWITPVTEDWHVKMCLMKVNSLHSACVCKATWR